MNDKSDWTDDSKARIFEIERERDISKCTTYYDTANRILQILGRKAKEETVIKLATCIKRYGHHAKLSVYERMDVYLEDDHEMKDFIKSKVETHTHLSSAKDEELIIDPLTGILNTMSNTGEL